MITIGVLLLLFMIPIGFIAFLIEGREETYNSARYDIMEKWGAKQEIEAPTLIIPYRHTIIRDDNTTETYTSKAIMSADKSKVSLNLKTEERVKGIFTIPVYKYKAHITGEFPKIDFTTILNPQQRDGVKSIRNSILWDKVMVSINIPNGKGIESAGTSTWNDGPSELRASKERITSIINNAEQTLRQPSTFSAEFSGQGSGTMKVIPNAKQTSVKMSANWPSPNFIGNTLPGTYTITDTSFEADWMHRNSDEWIQWNWEDTENDPYLSTNEEFLGAELIEMVDHYQQVTRSVKYAALFILFTMIAFFLFETTSGISIHPIQYLLVDAALVLFYLLLLSLSEHIAFLSTYLIASVATIGLITYYAFAVLKTKKRTLILMALLTIMYTFLYILLQLEEYALMVGSISLFFLLAAVMHITRKIDWGKLDQNGEQQTSKT